ncbi:MAG: DUF86 domain-containing protein [Rhodospirillaceae bacterium]|jgi:uncharacterized protein with HEPN domain|nr:DUF86 domain-containing protein [Rhodospirillales bacterium]MBT3906235.1 DUF86 domain-containing protein [Rhodospirillaceae bacterium]MBT4701032.1 DUF86 domain-containing protein [Rhodospirillaceae bacterium]MBT5033631.1 DUF86 domain-containing protein [Rhodospirillaceae bacterium]MBT6221510.1 DUF86 domain-containing protein [Rhodospirillaceae bacterium]
MPSKDPAQRFEDILENSKRIRQYTAAMTQADFIDDLKTIDAVERCFERIAEAVRKLGSEFDAKYPDLDLPALRQFGNVLRHDYDTVQPILLWGYIQKRLDTLEDMAQWELKE